MIIGIHAEFRSGTKLRAEPAVPVARPLAWSMAASWCFMPSIPPTARTATTASTITIVILMTNWNRSVTSTPHSPESVEMNEVSAMIPTTMMQGGVAIDPQDQRQDLHHRQVDPAQDDAVDGDGQVERAEAAQEGGGAPGIADLGEFHVGHHARPPPQARI